MICTDRAPFCLSPSWLWLALGRVPQPCPPPIRPCLCGCSLDAHDYDDIDGWGGCDDATHTCRGWWSPGNAPRAETTDHREQATCLDLCTCGGTHADGAHYYVSARRDDGAVSVLLGPYLTHPMALGMVDTGRRLAERVDARAHWYAFGTVAMDGDKPGVLNDTLEAEERDREAERDEAGAEKPKRKRTKNTTKAKEASHG
jgi:hypothetical protein